MATVNETEANAGLAVSNTAAAGAGAGANASCLAEMMPFVGSDTLAELVWSPQTGLNIKFAGKKPGFVWDVGPSDFGILHTQDGKHISESRVRSVVKSSESVDPLSKRLFENRMTRSVNGSGSGEHVESSSTHLATVKSEKDGSQGANFDTEKIAENGSMESFRNVNLLTKRKRSSFEHKPILTPKRTEKKKPGESSFVSWISNMLKGLKNRENFIKNIPLIENKREQKRISLYERVTAEAPKGVFDTIRRLRLSRSDILKLSNSRLAAANLDGFFLRLRVAKWEEGAGGSRYYVACITGLQGEKQPIRVKVGGVECLVETQYISNCDFLEDELVAWWQKTSKNGGIQVVKDLRTKLSARRSMNL